MQLSRLAWQFRAEGRDLLLRLVCAVPTSLGIRLRHAVLRRLLGGLGDRTVIQEGLRVTNPGKVRIGADCNFAIRVFITAGGGVTIGNFVGLGPDVKIWSVNHRYEDPDTPWLKQGYEHKPVVIEDDVWLGANCFVMPGCTIGRGAIVSAGTVLMKSVPAYALVAGNPGRLVGWRKRPEANVEPRSEAGIERGAEPGGTESVGTEKVPVAIGAVAAVASPAPRDTATIEPPEGPVRHLALALLVVLMLGCQVQESAPPALDIDQVRADLEVVAGARVFFGHQSVGRDLLAGIGALSTEAGVPLPIFDAAAGGTQGATGLFHANVGRNGAPDSKLIDFVAAASDAAQRFDLALLKFCYVDLGDESKEKSPSSLFERYETTMTFLQAQNPDLRLLHATMPLMSDPPGWKTTVKRWLGRPVWRDAAHARRGEYNERLRAKYGDAQTFDIARLESTDWDGSGSAFSIGGRVVETMVPEHTTDGGHLNEASNRLIAAAFLRSLAVALTRPDG